MKFSAFGQRFTGESGIANLMDDLTQAMQSDNPELCMLGGGNPAKIPEAITAFNQAFATLLEEDTLQSIYSVYSSQQGDDHSLDVLADFFNATYDWNISKDNILLTNGSQHGFFNLFNLLAGDMPDGTKKKILFPLTPEYIGYKDLGLTDDMFVAVKPKITEIDEQLFKYHIDFDAIEIDDSIAAICISRPTNPTGNVITDEEVAQLDALAHKHNIPLIIDNAYGHPFPGAIYTEAKPHWHSNIILGMSLSKFGLPGVRTGIMLADKKIIQALSKINGITCLAPNSTGAMLVKRLFSNGEIVRLRDEVVRPFYQAKMQTALALAKAAFKDCPVRIHQPEGAFFIWLWCQQLPISSHALYEKLKLQHVYVIPGEDFFFNQDTQWSHSRQCLRINYVYNDEHYARGLKIIAQILQEYS